MIIIQKLINLETSKEKERDKKKQINIPFLLNQLSQIHEWA